MTGVLLGANVVAAPPPPRPPATLDPIVTLKVIEPLLVPMTLPAMLHTLFAFVVLTQHDASAYSTVFKIGFPVLVAFDVGKNMTVPPDVDPSPVHNLTFVIDEFVPLYIDKKGKLLSSAYRPVNKEFGNLQRFEVNVDVLI